MHNTRSRSLFCKKKENLCVSTLHDGRPVSRYHPESVAIPNPPIVENTERHSGRLAAQRWDRANVADNRRVRQQEALGRSPEFIYRMAVRFSARIVRSWPNVDRMRCVELPPQHVTDRTRLPIYFHRARRTAVPPDVRRNSSAALTGAWADRRRTKWIKYLLDFGAGVGIDLQADSYLNDLRGLPGHLCLHYGVFIHLWAGAQVSRQISGASTRFKCIIRILLYFGLSRRWT